MLHVLFPGVCELVLEGYLLYGHAQGIRLLSEYFVSEPYGFIIKPYRLEYIFNYEILCNIMSSYLLVNALNLYQVL